MIKIFLPGAKADKNTRVRQTAIDNLIRDDKYGNHAYLEMGGEFGTTIFSDIFTPKPEFHIEAYKNNGERDTCLISYFDSDEN